MDQRGNENFRPYRGRRGWNSASWRIERGARQHDTPRGGSWISPEPTVDPKPYGPLLKSITIEDLDKEAQESESITSIKNCIYAASYSWLEKSDPGIVVPGKPPTWTPLKGSHKIPQDNGEYFRDKNSARYPKYPMEPAVQSVLKMNQGFQTNEVDVFGCSSTIGNLLHFARSNPKSFRMLVEAVGDTVFFLRQENSPRELIPNVKGCGHTFPEAYTTWDSDVKGSACHARIVKYQLGGMTFLVRFGCDGYIREYAEAGQHQKLGEPKKGGITAEVLDQSDLLGDPESLAISSKNAPGPGPLAISSAGKIIPQHAIFDLKTRLQGKQVRMEDLLPRLWISQIPNLITAYHRWGEFNDAEIHVESVEDRVREWKKENEVGLEKFVRLLRKVVEIARARKDGKIEICRTEDGALEIRAPADADRDVLPEPLKKIWSQKLPPSDALKPKRDEEGADTKPENDEEDNEPDYTACSAEGCGYCGQCTY
ncbi:hypothetical protein BDY21DRAFT_392438 [Lineolata rhizophorae]|uniref:Geranylgeranyl pyrophosphate synthetase n=1 Tax=Lineolata rhizophorae TaxID=578093 RepID=A0A6A6NZY3_9PEZI|nr:hypothetical protein BDY21DRAFT_392438 [Lineolata rhizophorae]